MFGLILPAWQRWRRWTRSSLLLQLPRPRAANHWHLRIPALAFSEPPSILFFVAPSRSSARTLK